MATDHIFVKGAREHNLKDIDVKIPRNRFIVITGLSGSGKSSLAFDTIYAEGQRRYMESLSSYARQFLGQMEKPDVDYIEGLSPAISIDQKTTSRNPRSTVGTVTEIHDYLRLLYARAGVPHCSSCGREITSQTVDQMADRIMENPEGTRLQLLAPVVRGRKGEYQKLLDNIRKNGFVRIRIDGDQHDINDEIKLDKNKKHTIEIIVDRIIIREGIGKRLADSLETILKISGGLAIAVTEDGKEHTYSQNLACPDCGTSIEELAPRMFSFNNPYGACETCSGLGTLLKIDPDLVIPDRTKSLAEGAIAIAGWSMSNHDSYSWIFLKALSEHYGFRLDTPVSRLPSEIMGIILYGSGKEKFNIRYERDDSSGSFTSSFEGVIRSSERRYRQTKSEGMKKYYESFMNNSACPACGGARLKKESLAVTIGDKNIHELSSMPVCETREFISGLKLTERQITVAARILKEINARIGFLNDVGLDYLTLSRTAGTLSGGEAQRIRLATQIGSGLTGVIYILDEPSIGLHQKDNRRLLETLMRLRDLGNTLIVVEHDEETICSADHIIDMGPGAGVHGGYVVAEGTPGDIMKNEKSLTGQYLSGKMKIEIPASRRSPDGRFVCIKGARENNLKNISLTIPLGVMVCVTGVSGSGKSSLINEVLYKKLAVELNRARMKPGLHDAVTGLENLDKVIDIDQSPIGRTPRSNPATYTGVFDLIRETYAATPEARTRGYKAGRFSFNIRGGRCEACKGDGIIKIEMHFLPDVYVPCEVCKGKRYNRETLEVRYKGLSIAELLDLTVEKALEIFADIPRIARKLQTLFDVGLGYIRLGQPSTTLSGGEAQRVKLATELSKRETGKTMYILDEPTTGLHAADVHRLTEILDRLVGAGNTVIVIEHNLDVIKTADHIIDLGPGGGDKGGYVIAQGSPEEVMGINESYTGRYLRKLICPAAKTALNENCSATYDIIKNDRTDE
ncbi:MAG: excinuclease ABC subunit UvrA [Eubacteriales bacterium]|nr:excinuclease ABC subunit UvrA [Eubacteriales bacterium]